MANNTSTIKLLFIINPGSGAKNIDWAVLIKNQCTEAGHCFEIFELPQNYKPDQLSTTIKESCPTKVIAVGGDGTISLVAECLLKINIPLGILPGGSANGMAKELGIPLNPEKAMEVCLNGDIKKIHLLEVNRQLCIHLSDLGFNAYVTKKFKALKRRGMLGYIKAGWRLFWNQQMMRVKIQMGEKEIIRHAIMVVIANATKYGTGVVINPAGKLDDDVFEIIVVKRISFFDSLKMLVKQSAFDPAKTEIFSTTSAEIYPKHISHFQVDGEYLGKVKSVKANIIANAIEVIVPGE